MKKRVLGLKTQHFHTEAAIRRCSLKKTPTQTFSYEYCEIFKNCFLYITTLETTSFHSKLLWKKLVLRIHWSLSTILKTSNKSVWSNVFWYVEVCIFWKCIRYTIHWDKIQILKKFTSAKINGTKNDLFFSWAPTHHSFTFNLRFLYELKHTVRLSKNVCVCVFLFY